MRMRSNTTTNEPNGYAPRKKRPGPGKTRRPIVSNAENAHDAPRTHDNAKNARVSSEKNGHEYGVVLTPPRPRPRLTPRPRPRLHAPASAPMNARDMQVYDMAIRKGADERRARQFVDIARKIRGRK